MRIRAVYRREVKILCRFWQSFQFIWTVGANYFIMAHWSIAAFMVYALALYTNAVDNKNGNCIDIGCLVMWLNECHMTVKSVRLFGKTLCLHVVPIEHLKVPVLFDWFKPPGRNPETTNENG